MPPPASVPLRDGSRESDGIGSRPAEGVGRAARAREVGMPFDGSNPVDGVAAEAPGASAGDLMRDATAISLPLPPATEEHLPGAAAWKDRLLALLHRVDAYLFPPVPNEPADVTPAQVLEE